MVRIEFVSEREIASQEAAKEESSLVNQAMERVVFQ